jgi:hypothetical protein
MRWFAPRAHVRSMRPRRVAGSGARPLNLAVRRPLRFSTAIEVIA